MVANGKHPRSWMEVRPAGLYCRPGDFYIDPVRPVERAIITHGHADHARSGHKYVLSTLETSEIMKVRYGANCAKLIEQLPYGKAQVVGDAEVKLMPAGHILGSAQVVIEYRGYRVVISGDYKRRVDQTCEPFVPVSCDVFITEATFGLPVFRHPPDADEIGRLLKSVELFPDRCHVVGAYALGKCQRIINLLREAGWDRPIPLHGALKNLCGLYERLGVSLGQLEDATVNDVSSFVGAIVLAPPSALANKWIRRLPEPVTAMASGWMLIRQRARQRNVELPMVISDHADWNELLQTLDDVAAPEVWVTHGREEALVRAAELRGIKAKALNLIGFEDDSA